jgi:hypothetical protein
MMHAGQVTLIELLGLKTRGIDRRPARGALRDRTVS